METETAKPTPVEATAATTRAEDEREYPPRKVVIPAMVAVYLVVFLIALDRTILGTAIPAISNEFRSFGDIAWYESGFLLPLCVLQLTFGRVYKFYSVKWVLAALVVIFEIGSIVAALAPTSAVLIVGRAITGVGGAGCSSGGILLINYLVPLERRPKYLGGVGSMFGLASIVGPLLGGYLTAVTWRWCFWINVPMGFIALVCLIFFCPKAQPVSRPATTIKGRIMQLDPLGFILIGPATICLLFALQYGGSQYPWNDGRIIALFVVFAVLFIAFIGSQAWRKEDATIPPRIFFQRSILAGGISSIGIGSLLVLFAFYLPIWFQAIQGKSPQNSGLSLIPLLLGSVVIVIMVGILTTVIGYYTPFLILGGAICIVGCGLISTWEVDASQGQWIGYQALVGFGLGAVLQGPNIAAQTVLSEEDVSIGLTLLTFIQFISGTVVVQGCQTLLASKLADGLAGKIPGFNPEVLARSGATSIREFVPPDKLPLVLEVYNDSLRPIWYFSIGLAGVIFLGAFGVEWKSVKAAKKPTDEEEVAADEKTKDKQGVVAHEKTKDEEEEVVADGKTQDEKVSL